MKFNLYFDGKTKFSQIFLGFAFFFLGGGGGGVFKSPYLSPVVKIGSSYDLSLK